MPCLTPLVKTTCSLFMKYDPKGIQVQPASYNINSCMYRYDTTCTSILEFYVVWYTCMYVMLLFVCYTCNATVVMGMHCV